ncbi:hypothetical protein ACPOL_4773 [Acidisarcina polymorpha]|uniref:Uncharacterized protein n=1 Tax=Acidisarcina polymorpha TaxID=2211140 RepID=A0A2Z5G4T8_9BACT|nr:hypothetical protein [Acidisarcina polymorpha]AXC14039.1 hypothetical protein ACPOL_4773 [Acidisarcina polymorpha]
MTKRLIPLVAALMLILTSSASFFWGRHVAIRSPKVSPQRDDTPPPFVRVGEAAPTNIYAHNLLLRKGPHFSIYIRWIQGQMVRTRQDKNPSFDDPESFVLMIQKGLISVRLSDLAGFLNAGATGGVGALTNVSIETKGDQIKIHGTAHKIIPLPVTIVGTLAPLPDGRIQFHILSFSVLRLPLKGLLGGFHLSLADLTPKSQTPGIMIAGNDFDFDTQRLLPPPHIHGQMTKVVLSSDQIRVFYGNAPESDAQLSEWHNFLKFSGGSLNFGKITMNDVDLTMIDASQDPWFDLDLVNYQAQLVQGYSRITTGAGLEIFMPDANVVSPKKVQEAVTLDWLKNRHSSLPADVPRH